MADRKLVIKGGIGIGWIAFVIAFIWVFSLKRIDCYIGIQEACNLIVSGYISKP